MPQKLPWEDWRDGDEVNTSAWVRATAPSGSAEFEGKVAWSGELGYGVRPPEEGQAADAAADRPSKKVARKRRGPDDGDRMIAKVIDWVVFAVAAIATLSGALGVVLSTNPVHAALMLVMTLFSVAVLFVAQEAHFLAAVQVIVYAGAIVVLFLFVIMLLGVDRSEDVRRGAAQGPAPAGHRRRPRASCRPCSCWPAPTGRRAPAAPAGRLGDGTENVELLARSLFTRYLLAFEITSVLLVIAVVGARCVPACRPRRATPTATMPVAGASDAVKVPGAWYLALAAALFTIGAVGLLVRRNVLVMFMCVELMLNAVNLTFVTFARMLDDIGGQTVVFFVLVVAAAEVVVGLGIIVSIFRRRAGATADDISPPQGIGAAPVLEAVWLIPALPLTGFVVLLVAGKRLGDPRAGLAGHGHDGRRLPHRGGRVLRPGGQGGRGAGLHPDPVHVDPRRARSTSTSPSWSTPCRSPWPCSSPASAPSSTSTPSATCTATSASPSSSST